MTLRDDKGRVLGGCADSIKVTVVATGKGKVHLQETAVITTLIECYSIFMALVYTSMI